MAYSGAPLRALFQLSRIFKDDTLVPTALVERLFAELAAPSGEARVVAYFGDLAVWDLEALRHGLALSEDLIAQYALHFHDPRVLPVTYYKREKWIRRYLDHQFSALIKTLARAVARAVNPSPGTIADELAPTLIVEEPIYFLIQLMRDRKFPKLKDPKAALEITKARLHLELSRHFERDPFSEGPRRVLLPHEIR